MLMIMVVRCYHDFVIEPPLRNDYSARMLLPGCCLVVGHLNEYMEYVWRDKIKISQQRPTNSTKQNETNHPTK